MIHTLAGTLTFKKISNLIEKKKPSIAWDREASIAFVLHTIATVLKKNNAFFCFL